MTGFPPGLVATVLTFARMSPWRGNRADGPTFETAHSGKTTGCTRRKLLGLPRQMHKPPSGESLPHGLNADDRAKAELTFSGAPQ